MIDTDVLCEALLRRRPELRSEAGSGLLEDILQAVGDAEEWAAAMQQLAYSKTLDRLALNPPDVLPWVDDKGRIIGGGVTRADPKGA